MSIGGSSKVHFPTYENKGAKVRQGSINRCIKGDQMYNQVKLITGKTAMPGGKAYSMLRYCLNANAFGRTADEQRNYADRWADRNGLPVDDGLTAPGHLPALEAFLDDVEALRVLPGSVLILDGLDATARMNPAIAQGQIGQIINAGVTVVTAADGRVYSPESTKAKPTELIHSLVNMVKAYDELNANIDPGHAEIMGINSIIAMKKPASSGKVYSYVRFSDMVQKSGHSADRQTNYAEVVAKERGMTLDETLTMRDEGKSAFHQDHVKTGAFGVFLKNIENGRVAPGSVLVVEGLDRLSRAEPIIAQAQLAQIINAGVTVITAADNKTYSRESLRANPMDLLYTLLVMIRAHEESATKSARVSKAIEARCQAWVSGAKRVRNPNGNDPHWLQWNGESFDLIEAAAERVRYIVDLYLKGYGFYRIARTLEQQEGREYQQYGAGYISKMLKRRPGLLIGTRIVTTAGGAEYALEDYYPAVISKETYNALLASFREPFTLKKGREPITPSILSGVNGLFRCGYCGSAMVSASGAVKSENGKDVRTRRFRCYNEKCHTRSVLIAPIENAIVDYCSNQMNLNGLIGRDRTEEIRARLAAARVTLSEHERQLNRVVDAMLGTDAPPAVFAVRAREIETEISKLNHAIKIDEAALLNEANAPTRQAAEHWAAVAQSVKDGDIESRVTVRKMVSDTFEKVVFYRYGSGADGFNADLHQCYKREKEWDIVLVSRSGVTRQLRIDRHGNLVQLADEARMA